MSRRVAKNLLWFAVVSSGCMSEELSQSQLDNYCKVDDDCRGKDVYACRLPKCQANQCTQGEIKAPGTTCKTTTCTGACLCGGPAPKPGVPQGIGQCLPHG